MRIGIGLPTVVPGVGDGLILDNYGPVRGPATVQALPTTPDGLVAMAGRLEDAGVDEMVTFPTLPEIDQVDRLADVLLR